MIKTSAALAKKIWFLADVGRGNLNPELSS